MFLTNISLFMGIFLIGFASAAADTVPSTRPAIVTLPLDSSYVPLGFDDNDRAQFVVEGKFHNTCYRVGPHALRIDQETEKSIRIQQQAYYYPGVCIQMTVPYTQTISAGLLKPGNYKIYSVFQDANGKDQERLIGELPVTGASNVGPDDFLYAKVDDAYVVSGMSEKKNTLVLVGNFQDRCTEFQEIKVGENKKVLIAQPIVRRTSELGCPYEKVRFLKAVELSPELHGTYLLHVRSLDGQAINKMIDVP